MDDDKWKVIDTHLSSMMDWTNNLNANSAAAQQGNARGGHIHRRSEPDAFMIRKAQQTRKNDDIPQSAPVQPGKFTLEWPAKPKKLPSADDVPTDEIINEIISETQNLIDIPVPNDNSNPPEVWLSPIPKSATVNFSNINKTEETAPTPRVAPGLTRSSTVSEVMFKSVESPPKPPPYHRLQSRPLETVSSNNVFVPLSIAPETSSYNTFNTIKGPPIVNHFGYGSPRSTRRSSMPGNQIDPRAHSASPNITRRSTSHSATANRRKTHDNLGFIPTITSIQNSDFESLTNHQPSAMIDPLALLSKNQFVPVVDQQPSHSVRCDDQEYTKALLQHQQERMQRLQKELNARREQLASLSTKVSEMETEVYVHRNEKLSVHMPTLDDVTNLRAANRQMEIDCNCMIKEVDMVSKSVSVGGNFYENINRKGSSGSNMKKRHSKLPDDLPSPPLPPPPIPPPLESDEENKWSCKWCTFLNHAALNKCEMCDYRRERVMAAS